MNQRRFLVAVVILALVSLACSININLPFTEVRTGPTQTDTINVPELEDPDDVAEVTIGFAAGELNISPGAEAALISGTATYNVPDFKPEVDINDNNIRISTGDLELRGIPDFGERYRNEWNLQLGEAPMDLEISAGAYQAEIELGGLALQHLEIADGAAEVDVSFSEPNQAEMDEFRYGTGASNVELTGLANANFETMIFKAGAGDYSLDFSGDLQRDADVTIDVGFSSVDVIVPEGVSARIFFDGGLANVDISGDWDRSGDDYIHAGSGPTLTINVNMGAGELNLRER